MSGWGKGWAGSKGPSWPWGIVWEGREEEETSVAPGSNEQTEWGYSSRKSCAQTWGTSLGLVAWGQCPSITEGSLQSSWAATKF